MKNATHLFIDISNSWTKYCDGSLTHLGQHHRIPTQNLNSVFVASLKKLYPKSQPIISSVVPFKNVLFKKHWKGILWVNHKSKLGITIRYPKPEKIGADRLANAAAAASLYPCPLIVVDFGTAVTFDTISPQKEYLGGAIAPGLSAMTDYLHQRTALLPHLQLQEPIHAIGKSTVEAMQVGAVIGYRGLVKEIIRSIRNELKHPRVKIIATGGYVELIAKNVSEISEIRPLLTLEGLQIIAKNESN